VHAYRAFGLGIRSAIALPELVRAPGPSDVVIRRGAVPGAPRDGPGRGGLFHAGPGEAGLHWPDAGALLLRDGREITVDARPDADPRALRLYLLGPALALLLHQRGALVLHASAVARDGGVIAVLGRSGQGKSTTAAALVARGHPLVADDVVAVDLERAPAPLVSPAYPQLKLWPDAVSALGGRPEALPRVHPAEAKRARLAGEVPAGPLPLRRCYVLADGDRIAIEPLRGHPAVFELVQHSYVAPALAALATSAHLARCARLAAAVPVRRLRRPRALDGLAALAEAIERDAA
jgi:hypothetical protein